MTKRILSAVLCFFMLFTIVDSQVLVANAESTTPAVLTKLMKKFPHRAYWNHVGSSKNNPDGVTNTPCPTHSGCSWVPDSCTCNSFGNAIQCMGFAYKSAYDIVGTDPRTWEVSYELDSSKLRVGDIIRYRGDRHSLTVTGVKGNVISFVDANWYPMCQIRWSQMDLDDMPGFSYVQHEPKNKLKNKNINFYVNMVEKIESALAVTPSAPTIDTSKEAWTTTDSLNLRKKPSTSSKALYMLGKGDVVYPTQKKVSGGYLWGKVKVGSTTGWVALDYCKYVSGENYAPEFTSFSDIQPAKTRFRLKWSAVQGADKYKVFFFDLYGNRILTETVETNSVNIKLDKTGKYLVKVKSYSNHAPSWSLKSADKYVTILDKKDIVIESIQLSEKKIKLEAGEEYKLTFSFDPYCASDDAVFWYSENSKIATVDDEGKVVAKKFGQTNVVVESKDSKGEKDACAVTVCPVAPSGLKQDTSKISSHSVTLRWNKVSGISGYYIYKRTSKGKFKLIATTSSTSYKDTDIAASKEFFYKVCAFVNVGDNKIIGFDSGVLSAVTAPEKVNSISASTKKGKVTLKWKKNSSVNKYIIYQYSKIAKKYTRIGVTEKNSFAVKCKSGEKTSFKVKAVKTVGNRNFASYYSPRVTVKIA